MATMPGEGHKLLPFSPICAERQTAVYSFSRLSCGYFELRRRDSIPLQVDDLPFLPSTANEGDPEGKAGKSCLLDL